MLQKLYITLRAQGRHPLNRKAAWRAALDFSVAQVAARLVPGEVCVPFPNGTKLLVPPRMKGAAHFIYPGLCEFEDMGFVLHFLRPDDLFVDIGANIGAYTVLAGGAVGSHVVAFEPAPTTFQSLLSNIQLNGLANRTVAHNLALGKEEGVLQMSAGLGTENCVQPTGGSADTVTVKVSSLDRILGQSQPALLKIDVEGFETEVMRGARAALAKSSLQAMIIEKNGGGTRYGFDEAALHQEIRKFGFQPCAYSPLDRALRRIADNADGNIIYVKNFEVAQQRLKEAPPFKHGAFSI
jgi:FkbM family methyltransferase